MYQVKQTDEFRSWVQNLRDVRANTLIVKRIDRIYGGNLGDHKQISSKVSELRIDYGPGYRIYYTKRGNEIILLLIGGNKSTQQSDIKKANDLAAKLGGPK
jgi:putative addiction module killer protein